MLENKSRIMGIHKKNPFITFMYMYDRQWSLKYYLNCGAKQLCMLISIFFRGSLHNHLSLRLSIKVNMNVLECKTCVLDRTSFGKHRKQILITLMVTNNNRLPICDILSLDMTLN